MLATWILMACLCSVQAETTTPAAKKVSASTRPARGQKSQPYRKTLEQIGEMLGKGDLIGAQLVREQYPLNEKLMDQKLRVLHTEVEQKLKEAVSEQELEVTPDYIWLHKPAVDKQWGDEMTLAERKTPTAKSGIVVMRIRLEDPSREKRIGVLAGNVQIHRSVDSGYSSYDAPANGDFLLLGRGSSSGVQQHVEIKSMGHACPKLKLVVPDEGVACGGELLVRALPPERVGSLRVRLSPESGLSTKAAAVRVGRHRADSRDGYPVSSDRTCTIENLGAGPCDLYAVSGEALRGPHQTAVIEAGKVTEVTLPLCAPRRVEFECKYRIPAGEGEWKQTTSAAISGEPTSFDVPQSRGSLCLLSDWDGRGMSIRRMNAPIMPAAPADFEKGIVASEDAFRTAGFKDHPLESGSVFAIRFRDRQSEEGEAIVRVRSIERAIAAAGSAPEP